MPFFVEPFSGHSFGYSVHQVSQIMGRKTLYIFPYYSHESKVEYSIAANNKMLKPFCHHGSLRGVATMSFSGQTGFLNTIEGFLKRFISLSVLYDSSVGANGVTLKKHNKSQKKS